MSITLEDSANAPLKPAGSRQLTSKDKKILRKLTNRKTNKKFYIK